MRDAKHYYGLTLERGTISVTQGEDDSIYAYRQINEVELIRSAIIQMNDVMYQVGKLDFENKSGNGSVNGNSFGGYSFAHQSTMNIGKEYKFTITGYSSDMLTPGGVYKSSFQINLPESSTYRSMGTQGGYPTSFDSTTITVKSNDSSNSLSSYCGNINFSLSSHSSGSLSCGNTSISMSSDTARRKWIPFKLNGDENWYHDNSTYGWWN